MFITEITMGIGKCVCCFWLDVVVARNVFVWWVSGSGYLHKKYSYVGVRPRPLRSFPHEAEPQRPTYLYYNILSPDTYVSYRLIFYQRQINGCWHEITQKIYIVGSFFANLLSSYFVNKLNCFFLYEHSSKMCVYNIFKKVTEELSMFK